MSSEGKVAVYYKINEEDIHHVILVNKDEPLHDQLMDTQLMGIKVKTNNLQGILMEQSPFKFKMKGRRGAFFSIDIVSPMSIERRTARWLLDQADNGMVEELTAEPATDSDWMETTMGTTMGKPPEKIPIVYLNHVVQESEIDERAMASKTEKFDIAFKPGSKHEHDFTQILQNIEEKLARIEDCACLPKAYLANAAVKTLKETKRNIVTTPEPTLDPKKIGGSKRRRRKSKKRKHTKKRKSKKKKTRRRRKTRR